MSPWQTALIYAGIPLLVVAFIAFAVYGRSALHQPNRYRPGRPWNYPSAWYVPHPAAIDDAVSEHTEHRAIEGSRDESATASGTAVAVGGATGEW